MHTRSS